jgi:hypothetical protein
MGISIGGHRLIAHYGFGNLVVVRLTAGTELPTLAEIALTTSDAN